MKKILILLGCLVVAVGLIIGFSYYRKASSRYDGDDVLVKIPHGLSEDALIDSLGEKLGEEFASNVVDLMDKLPGEDAIRSGAYMVKHGDKAVDVAKKLKRGLQTPVKVTFNNIRTMDQLAESLSSQMEFSKEDFISAADSILQSSGISKANYPAHFLPDTYEVYWDESPEKLIGRITSHCDKFWNEERRSKASRLNLTPEEVVTVASIVEEETNKVDERSKVARLYLNRLGKGMKLQADPTVKFAVGDFGLRRITSNHLKVNSPYNTYQVTGLPPGPIRLAESRTIDQVLDAPTHNYIYMCAKEDFSGYHNFSADYATHQANARRYHAALEQRGIK